MYDVIVVGGGHNGLTCGAYLARAGRRVVVLESRSIVGGMCTTEETVAEAPGFKMNPCAVDTALTNTPVSVIEEHFERDEVKAVLANLGAWSMLPLQEPGSGGGLAMMCSYFGWGVTRPVGGSGDFTKALAACVRDHGGEGSHRRRGR